MKNLSSVKVDSDLIEKAMELTGVKTKRMAVEEGLFLVPKRLSLSCQNSSWISLWRKY